MKDFNGLTFHQLPRQYIRRIQESQIIAYTVEKGTPDAVVFNIFQRNNTGGLKLDPQEIRHALYQGKATRLTEALAKSKEFLDATDRSLSPNLCKKAEKGHMTNIEKIVIARDCDYTHPLAPNFLLQQIVQKIVPLEDRRYLMSLLKNRDTIPEEENPELFCFDGKTSALYAYAKEDIVISLLSNQLFSTPALTGHCEKSEVSIRNLSKEEHLQHYESNLGIRHYHANSVKHKAHRVNKYGKGKQANPMDLEDETAQRLLNRAIFVNGRLYAKKNGKIYAFMQESPCVYHGYIDDEASESVRRKPDKVLWD